MRRLRVLSYNIRVDNPTDDASGWGWSQRGEAVAGLVRLVDPDLWGAQEVGDRQWDDLRTDTTWQAVGDGRDADRRGERSAVWFRRDRFRLVDAGTFWLSPTPEVAGSVGWDAALPRVCTWARLDEAGDTIVFANAHFDHLGAASRRDAALLVVDRLDRVARGAPVVFTGDINSTPAEEPYRILTQRWSDARLRGARFGPVATFTGFDLTLPREDDIDVVLTSQEFAVSGTFTLPVGWKGRFVSDHCPVVADLGL